MRVLHLIPDAPAVDVRIDGALPDEWRALAFGGAPAYRSASARTSVLTMQVAPSTTPDAPRPLLTSSRIDLQRNTDYTFVLSGRLAADSAADDQPTFAPYIDDNTAPPAGTTRVRVLHASPDAGPVDVYALPAGTTTIPATATPLVRGMSFRSARAATPTAGSYALLLTRVNERTPVLLVQDNVTLAAGAGVTVLARGVVRTGAPPAQALRFQLLVDR